MRVVKQLPGNFPEQAQTPFPDRRERQRLPLRCTSRRSQLLPWARKRSLPPKTVSRIANPRIKAVLSPLATRNFDRREPPHPGGTPRSPARPGRAPRIPGAFGTGGTEATRCCWPAPSEAPPSPAAPRMAPGAPCEAAGPEARTRRRVRAVGKAARGGGTRETDERGTGITHLGRPVRPPWARAAGKRRSRRRRSSFPGVHLPSPVPRSRSLAAAIPRIGGRARRRPRQPEPRCCSAEPPEWRRAGSGREVPPEPSAGRARAEPAPPPRRARGTAGPLPRGSGCLRGRRRGLPWGWLPWGCRCLFEAGSAHAQRPAVAAGAQHRAAQAARLLLPCFQRGWRGSAGAGVKRRAGIGGGIGAGMGWRERPSAGAKEEVGSPSPAV